MAIIVSHRIWSSSNLGIPNKYNHASHLLDDFNFIHASIVERDASTRNNTAELLRHRTGENAIIIKGPPTKGLVEIEQESSDVMIDRIVVLDSRTNARLGGYISRRSAPSHMPYSSSHSFLSLFQGIFLQSQSLFKLFSVHCYHRPSCTYSLLSHSCVGCLHRISQMPALPRSQRRPRPERQASRLRPRLLANQLRPQPRANRSQRVLLTIVFVLYVKGFYLNTSRLTQRQVIGTAFTRSTTGLADCQSYLATTVTPATVYVRPI